MNRSRRLFMLFSSCVLAAVSAPVLALDAPVGPVVLTISGNVSATNRGATAAFSMAMLQALPQQTFTTKTPWYPAPMTFTGPLLRDVLAAAGATGSKLQAVSLNDYKVDIPFSDATQESMIVAHLLNGKPMLVRERGPLFIVYPFDSKPALNAERFYSRSAWQLTRLVVQ